MTDTWNVRKRLVTDFISLSRQQVAMNLRRLTSSLFVALLLASCSDHAKRNFEADRWKRANTLMSRDRSEMLDDLLNRHSLIGLTRAQVISRLGEPNSGDLFKEWSLVYMTGPEDWDSEWLVLRLDPRGHVSEQQVVVD